jgi:hypothetical protein
MFLKDSVNIKEDFVVFLWSSKGVVGFFVDLNTGLNSWAWGLDLLGGVAF